MPQRWFIAVVAIVLAQGAVRAGDGEPAAAEGPQVPAAPVALPSLPNWSRALPNLPTVTLGGEQAWSDELVFRGWRIQLNVVTGHYRLLDAKDVRRAWGTWEQCRTAFDEAKQRDGLKPLAGPVVVTLHGLGRSRDHMAGITQYLEREGKLLCVDVGYASTRRSLDEHAQSLARVIENLEAASEIHLVCHSLGNLVARRYLGEANCEQPRWQVDPRIKRMVMLAPPNNGAQLAGLIAAVVNEAKWAQWLAGPSATMLALDWDAGRKLLATPAFPFGIIAGGCGDERGLNPLLDGDDDMVVCVEETRLAGAHDFRVVRCRHGDLMDDSEVRKYTLSFLQHGYFTAESERQPIVPEDAKEPSPVPNSRTQDENR